jgi:tRNA threonylcarbamoyladenosine biosynthesis protein TsaE
VQIFCIENEKNLDTISSYILKNYPKGIIVLLNGDLGSGKSTFVKNFVKLKTGKDLSSSPTFSIVHTYEEDIFHYDIYRISSKEFIEQGLYENFEKEGFHFIEWADDKIQNLLEKFGFRYINIDIKVENEKRIFKIF